MEALLEGPKRKSAEEVGRHKTAGYEVVIKHAKHIKRYMYVILKNGKEIEKEFGFKSYREAAIAGNRSAEQL